MSVTADSYEKVLLALCIFREARGQSRKVKLAVKHVVMNRVANPAGPYARCKDIVTNVLAPKQFSSFNHGDPNATLLPSPSSRADWQAWLDCCEVVDSQDPDPTFGANHYFDKSINPPPWAEPSKATAVIGDMRFFKL